MHRGAHGCLVTYMEGWCAGFPVPWLCSVICGEIWAVVCREGLLSTGIAPVLKARSAETWVEWALPGMLCSA